MNELKSNLMPAKADCVYTSCYCEENVWMLCKHVKENAPDSLSHTFALFISNPARSVPLWKQQNQKNEHIPVVWDYHVICLHATQINNRIMHHVYDLDSTLPFPCTLTSYIEAAFHSDDVLKPQFRRFIRVVPAQMYLEKFASDRSHMKTEDGGWNAPPPSYPCISTNESAMNLDSFISMVQNHLGTVYSLNDFRNQFF